MAQTEIPVADDNGNEFVILKTTYENRPDVNGEGGKSSDIKAPTYNLMDTRNHYLADAELLAGGNFKRLPTGATARFDPLLPSLTRSRRSTALVKYNATAG